MATVRNMKVYTGIFSGVLSWLNEIPFRPWRSPRRGADRANYPGQCSSVLSAQCRVRIRSGQAVVGLLFNIMRFRGNVRMSTQITDVLLLE